MLSLNEKHVPSHLELLKNNPQMNVISFSHFVPRRELLPPKWILFERIRNILPRVCGDTNIDTFLRKISSKVHVFGHTHIDYDKVIDGVRYVQHAFGYPTERKSWKKSSQPYSPKQIFPIDEKCILQ